MRFRLSTLLLLTTVIALAVGWVFDRKRLLHEIGELNAECADYFRRQPEVIQLKNDHRRLNRSFLQSEKMFYDASDPEDRRNYREGQLSKRVSGAE
jgi:cell shape-determining protein MreC